MITLCPVHSAAEIELVSHLAETCWHWHYTSIIGKDQVSYMLEHFQSPPAIRQQIDDGREYFLIRDTQQEPHGYLAHDLHPDHLFLSKIYILPTSQRRGIGQMALEHLIERHPHLDIHLTVNKYNHQAIAFYGKSGFTRQKAIVTDIGGGYVMDDWLMVRTADPNTYT